MKFNTNFILAEHLFKRKLYGEENVRKLVVARLLTEEEYEEIVGKEYVPNEA